MADNLPASPIDICNLSLTELKTDPIESLDQEGSTTAELCKRHYDLTRQKILRSHVWNFAKSELSLARATNATSVSFPDVYPLASAYIRLISIGDVLVGSKRCDFDIRSVLVDSAYKTSIVIDNNGGATLDIVLIRNVTSVSEFDALFTVLFKFELAAAIAPGLTLKPSVKKSIKEDLDDARLQARGIDGQERPPVRTNNSKFLNARRYALRRRPIVKTDFE